MKAVQYRQIGAAPEVVEVDPPTPGPGEVLLRVTAAGLCHSDVFVMSVPAEQYAFGSLPLTLGHEGVGIVAEVGAGVRSVAVGDAVAVYGPWGCGTCLPCSRGDENYCTRASDLGIFPPGLGSPGAMAEYMVVDSDRHLVPIFDLDPAEAAPLTDAGLTPYHAIKSALPKLGAGTTAVVLGAGGLGHVGIQILAALTGTRIVALDVDDAKLALARESGAHETLRSDDPDVVAAVRTATGGGASVVFDFAGFQASLDVARQVVGVGGDIHIVGIGMGGGTIPVGFFATPYETSVLTSYWGSRSELIEVVELARRGQIRVHVERFGIDDAPAAYQKLHDGSLRGRAVIVLP
ncbi:MAG: NAD(P)-dependent alcohol dehydrogenase [Acidimicrobiales bacterium]